jgi:hypothetical protein
LPITVAIIWRNLAAIWSALDARMRPKTVREFDGYDVPTLAGPSAARQVILRVRGEEEQRLLEDNSCP